MWKLFYFDKDHENTKFILLTLDYGYKEETDDSDTVTLENQIPENSTSKTEKENGRNLLKTLKFMGVSP